MKSLMHERLAMNPTGGWVGGTNKCATAAKHDEGKVIV